MNVYHNLLIATIFAMKVWENSIFFRSISYIGRSSKIYALRIDWENISYMVALSTFCSNQDYKGQILTGDLKDMLEFSESIGHILKFKEYYYKEQIRGILQGWGRYMGQPCFYLLHTMREDLKNEYFEFVCENYFFYNTISRR